MLRLRQARHGGFPEKHGEEEVGRETLGSPTPGSGSQRLACVLAWFTFKTQTVAFLHHGLLLVD